MVRNIKLRSTVRLASIEAFMFPFPLFTHCAILLILFPSPLPSLYTSTRCFLSLSPLTFCCPAVPGMGTGMAQLERVCDLLLSECWCPGEQSRLAQLWHWQRIMVGGEFVLFHCTIFQLSYKCWTPEFVLEIWYLGNQVKCLFQIFSNKISFYHRFFCLSNANFLQQNVVSDQNPAFDTRPLSIW